MAKTKRRIDPNTVDPVALHVAGLRVKNVERIIIPTDDPRHMPYIRNGKFDPSVFSGKARTLIAVDPDVSENRDKKGRRPQKPKMQKHKKGQRRGD